MPRERIYMAPAPMDAPKAASIGVTGLIVMALLFAAIVVFDVVTLQRRRRGVYRKASRSAFPKKVSLRQRIVHVATSAASPTPPSRSSSRNGGGPRHRFTVTSRNGDVRLTVRSPLLVNVIPADDDGRRSGAESAGIIDDDDMTSPFYESQTSACMRPLLSVDTGDTKLSDDVPSPGGGVLDDGMEQMIRELRYKLSNSNSNSKLDPDIPPPPWTNGGDLIVMDTLNMSDSSSHNITPANIGCVPLKTFRA